MAKRLGKVIIEWRPAMAYAIGLLVSDGNLSKDGRHINFTTKDLQLAWIFKRALGLNNKIGRKRRSGGLEKKYFVVQFGDRSFYEFLTHIGLMPRKSLIIGEVKIPDDMFFHFFRGCIDGDGSIGSFMHPESCQPQVRIRLASGSIKFLKWMKRQMIKRGISCHIKENRRHCYELAFGKASSLFLFSKMYNTEAAGLYLLRKFNEALPFMRA